MATKKNGLTVALVSTWIFGVASGFFLRSGLESVRPMENRAALIGNREAPIENGVAPVGDELRARYQKSCTKDAEKFCSDVTPGEGRKHRCLASHKEKISAPCRELLPYLH